MNAHHTFHLRLENAHAVLPRILLAFSRRRLRIAAVHFFDLDDARPAELQIDLECAERAADEVERQLRRVVEVATVRVERLPEAAPRPALATAV